MAEPHPIPTGPRFQDLTGRVFGKLTVLFYAGLKNIKHSTWHCRCECGREHTVYVSQLTLGKVKSCPTCARHRGPREKTNKNFEDLTGQTFGRLTVVSIDRRVKRPGGVRNYFLCHCSCGESKVVRGDILKDGRTASCGCLNVVRYWYDEPKPETQACTNCNRILPLNLEFFYRHPSGKHGFLPRCKECIKEEKRQSWKLNGKRMRLEVLIHYGGDPPRCACCEEAHVEFLAIDHIEGGGGKHRQKIGAFYPWLIRNKFPKGFRVLCHNCNFSRGLYGYCPHKR
jgi:hypothetical protein